MITFAPSSAGKSFYCAEDPRQRIDFDIIVKGFIGWPQTSRWWTKSSINEKQQQKSFNLLIAVATLHRDKEILFNMSTKFVDISQIEELGLEARVVIPPFERIMANAELKREEQRRGRKTGQPVDGATLRNNWEAWRSFIAEHDLEFSTTFSSEGECDQCGGRVGEASLIRSVHRLPDGCRYAYGLCDQCWTAKLGSYIAFIDSVVLKRPSAPVEDVKGGQS